MLPAALQRLILFQEIQLDWDTFLQSPRHVHGLFAWSSNTP